MEKDNKELLGGMAGMAEDLRESLEEALSALMCVKVSAEASCEGAHIIRSIGAVEKLLAYAMKNELAELEALVESILERVFKDGDS